MSNYEPDEVYLKLSLSLLSFFSSSVAVLTDPEAIGCWFIPCELHSFLQIVENVRAGSHLACLRDWSCRIWPSLPTTPVRRLYLLSFTHAPEFHPHQHPPLFPFFFFARGLFSEQQCGQLSTSPPRTCRLCQEYKVKLSHPGRKTAGIMTRAAANVCFHQP